MMNSRQRQEATKAVRRGGLFTVPDDDGCSAAGAEVPSSAPLSSMTGSKGATALGSCGRNRTIGSVNAIFSTRPPLMGYRYCILGLLLLVTGALVLSFRSTSISIKLATSGSQEGQ